MKRRDCLALMGASSLLLAGCAGVPAATGTGDLGVVVARSTGTLAIVNTSQRTLLAEVKGLGDLSHASVVFSRDGRYAFVFGRDGALTKVDPIADIEVIQTELCLADLGTVEKAQQRYTKAAKSGNDKEAAKIVSLLTPIQAALNEGKPARTVEVSKEDAPLLKQFCLITSKPAMFVGNVSEDGFENNPLLDRLKEYAAAQNAPVVAICAKIESEMSEMSDEDRDMFLAEMGQDEPGLNRLIRAGFKLLGLQTYFTAGVKEVRAWTIHVGDTAPQAAGVIHGDFERGFIRAQTIAFEDFIQYKGEQGAKDAGKMRAEGKEYVVKDGDVLNFLFNV